MANRAVALPQQVINWRPRILGDLFPAILALCVIGMVGAPLVVLAISSFRPPTALPFDDVGWTTANVSTVFLEANTYTLLKNTFFYAAGSLALSLPLAFALAWLVERTDLPFRRFLYTAMFVPMVIPPLRHRYRLHLPVEPLQRAFQQLHPGNPVPGHSQGTLQHLQRVGDDIRHRHAVGPVYVADAAAPLSQLGPSNGRGRIRKWSRQAGNLAADYSAVDGPRITGRAGIFRRHLHRSVRDTPGPGPYRQLSRPEHQDFLAG